MLPWDVALGSGDGFGTVMTGYVTESRLASESDGPHRDLATALGVTQGRVANPVFFKGFLVRPDVASSGLLAVAEFAGSRYAYPGLAHRAGQR